ncbi:MAG: hypothetical protein JW925_02945, partial [Syntrophaceae bacterium]|nr:hypothetical protein [Syntrophaceae bacterium]
RKVILLIAVLILLFICIIAIYRIHKAFTEPADVEVNVDMPKVVKVNEEFNINFIIKNKAEKTEEFQGLDIDKDLIKSMTILASKPNYQSAYVGKATGNQIYKYYLPLSGKSETNVNIKASIIEPGLIRGKLTIFINSRANPYPHRFEIKANAN